MIPYIVDEESFFKMLEAIVASKFPIPIQMFYSILGLKPDRDIPRVQRKTKKDALSSLHSLFPVENDNVTAFHKSVVDWLTLHDDEEHEFSVRVENGNEVLASQCYDVLSDIRNGRKDLDKPLNLTNSEKYVLGLLSSLESYRLDYTKPEMFVEKIFILSAFLCYEREYGPIYETGEITALSDKFNYIYRLGKLSSSLMCLVGSKTGSSSAIVSDYFNVSNFALSVEFCLHAANLFGAREKDMSSKPTDLLRKYQLSYFEVEKLPMSTQVERASTFEVIVPTLNGFLLVEVETSTPKTVLRKYQLDGKCLGTKCFPGQVVMQVLISPNYCFAMLVATGGHEVIDLRTLEAVASCQWPSVVTSCHVFGNQPDRHKEDKFRKYLSETGNADGTELRLYYRKFYLRHLTQPNYLPKEIRYKWYADIKGGLKFSSDGLFLAYFWEVSIFVLRTSDGSLHKRVRMAQGMSLNDTKILLVSEATIILQFSSSFLEVIVVISLNTSEIKHMFCVPEDTGDLHVVPTRQGEQLTLLTNYDKENKCVSKYVFQNLDI